MIFNLEFINVYFDSYNYVSYSCQDLMQSGGQFTVSLEESRMFTVT